MDDAYKRVSVRTLVEFILREGDIVSGAAGVKDAEVMQEGARIHRYLQKKGGPDYSAEVFLSHEEKIIYEECPVLIKVEGRADGIIDNDNGIIIHEIKSMYSDVTKLKEAYNIHQAQAKCYAAIYCLQNNIEEIIIRMTYCQIETMLINEFDYRYASDEIIEWFRNLLYEYAKWLVWEHEWVQKRNKSIKEMKFPFDYREGQFELVKNVYLSILRKKNLFLQAPTGVGKTISTVFPAVTGMGQEIVSKIFYLTAKTITRTVAEDTFKLLIDNGVRLKVATITAKEKICVLDKPNCNPESCERAKGHYDRVNEAIYDMLVNEERISRDTIEDYAKKYMVCPFEMCLDVTMWCDVIICDYNYVFDPVVHLKRYFGEGQKDDYVFLVDESHNLVDRARSMYSARIDKGLVMDIRALVKTYDKKLYKALDGLNSSLLSYKRQCEEFMLVESIGDVVLKIMRVLTCYDDFLQETLPKLHDFGNTDDVMKLYFELRFFLAVHDLLDDKYRIYADYGDRGEFGITLNCMDPSTNLKEYLKKGRSAIFFSATLLPVRYYIEQLGGDEEDYAVYAESPFKSEQQLVMIATDVSSRYSRRGEEEYRKIAEYINTFVKAKKGNYIVFYPSYKMMMDVYEYVDTKNNMKDNTKSYTKSNKNYNEENAEDSMLDTDTTDNLGGKCVYVLQQPGMNEEEREEFLRLFKEENDATLVGMCVMGGIFGEGIDLRDDMLIGAVIVGTGLPMVGNERELYRNYYDEVCGSGFEYAYLYPGMNKVLQAAGRVIRTATDKGCILLLDERFANNQYRALFPREWKEHEFVNIRTINERLDAFWRK